MDSQPQENRPHNEALASLSVALVRRLVIDWRAIAKETGCTRGTLAHSPVFGWGVRGNGPADFCAITPPAIAEGEELRIEEGMWAVYSPNAGDELRPQRK